MMPCLESICTRVCNHVHTYVYVCVHACRYTCKSTTNAIDNDEFVEQRQAFSTRMHPLTLFFVLLSRFLLSSRTSYRATIFFFSNLRSFVFRLAPDFLPIQLSRNVSSNVSHSPTKSPANFFPRSFRFPVRCCCSLLYLLLLKSHVGVVVYLRICT